MTGRVLISIRLTARLAGVTVQAVRVAIRRGRLTAVTLARNERTAVRGVDLHDAARYYGWPPALVDRLADEMRAGIPPEKDVFRIDTESEPDGQVFSTGKVTPAGQDASPDTQLTPAPAATPPLTRDQAPNLNPEPSSARDAWKRAAKRFAPHGRMPNEAPSGFRLVLPRDSAALAQREVHDLVVDGEVVGTLTDQGFAGHIVERCELGEVFVDCRGSVAWRPRLPLPTDT